MSQPTPAEDAFGVFQKRAEKDNTPFVYDRDRLKSIANKKDTAAAVFCKSCGRHFGLSRQGVRELVQNEDIRTPDGNTEFLTLTTCSMCKSEATGKVEIQPL